MNDGILENEKGRADFGEGDATKRKAVKRESLFTESARHSAKEGFGKELHKNGNSVKRVGAFSENENLLHSSSSQVAAPRKG